MTAPTDMNSWHERIKEAMKQGHQAKDIVQWIINLGTGIAPSLQSAKKQGYSDDQIVNYMTHGEAMSYGQKQASLQGMSEQEAARKLTQAPRQVTQKAASMILPIAGTVGAAMALRRAVPAILQNVLTPKDAIGTPPPGTPPPAAPSQPAQPAQPSMMQGIMNDAQAMQQPQAQPPPAPSQEPMQGQSILETLGLKDKIISMVNEGHQPTIMGLSLINKMSPEQRKIWRDYANKNKTTLENEVRHYITDEKGLLRQDLFPIGEQGQPKIAGEMEKKQTQYPADEPNLAQTSGMGSLVFDVNKGRSGTVKHSDESKVLMDVDGRHEVAAKDDVVAIPPELHSLDYDEMAKKYKETFPAKGPGSLSTNVASLSYNPNTKELLATFVTSPDKVYRYQNVESELYDKIKSQSVAPKTTGTGFLGEWDVSIADSIGSPFYEIKKNKEKYPYDIFPIGYNMMSKLLEAISKGEKQHAKEKRASQKLKK